MQGRIVIKGRTVLELIERGLSTVSGVTAGIMMLMVTVDVMSRYIIGPSVPGVFETVELLMITLIFFAIAYCEAQEEHIRINMVLQRLNQRWQHIANTFAALCGVAVSVLIAWQAAKYTIEAFTGGYMAGPTAPVPIWPFVASISVGSFVLCLRFTVNAISHLLHFRD